MGSAGAACAQSRLWKLRNDVAEAGPLLELRRKERDEANGALDIDASSLEVQGRAYLAKSEAERIERNVAFLEDTLGWTQGRVFVQRATITVLNLEQEVDFWTKGLGMETSREITRDVDGTCVNSCALPSHTDNPIRHACG